MQEKTIQTKNCKHCNSNFEITNKDMEFYNKVSPVSEWKKYQIPTPTLCPDCRNQRRLCWRNERNLYRRDCDATGKEIISIYSPDKEVKVYSQEEWWSDNWDALDYWIDFDFNKSFFEQFWELISKVPVYAIMNSNTQKSEYCNYIYWAKDSYLSFVVYWDSERIFYWNWIFWSTNLFDCDNCQYCEQNYYCVDNLKSYNCFYSHYLSNSDNCYYSRNLTWCSFCIGCANLSNKQYYVFNKKVSKDEFEKYIENIHDKEFSKRCYEFIKKQFHKSDNNVNSENVLGNNIKDSRNCFYCFDIIDSEDSKYVVGEEFDNCWDWIWWGNSVSYEFTRVWRSQNVIFSDDCIESYNIILSKQVYNSNNCFWCSWLKNKQYCILNKQYTKQEYEKLVPKIIEHMQKTWEWWEFFPSSISPFWYNETVSQEFFPLNKEEWIDKWFNWSDYEPPKPNVEKIIPAEKLPENIEDIPDDILNWAIKCEITWKPFRIIKQELEFYRKHKISIPRKHPDQRHLERVKSRNPQKLFDRKCDKCWIEMKTTYSPDRGEIVYCEKCYEKEVY